MDIPVAALERCRAFVDAASRVVVSSRKEVRARAYASYVGVKMGACMVAAGQAKRVAMEEDHSDLDTLGWLLSSVCMSKTEAEEASKQRRGFRLWGLFGDSPGRERIEALEGILWRVIQAFDDRSKLARAQIEGDELSAANQQRLDVLWSADRALAVGLEGVIRALDSIGKSPKGATMRKRCDDIAAAVLDARGPHGRWATTQETGFACTALAMYFHAVETGAGPSVGTDDTLGVRLTFNNQVFLYFT
jgi:hypothetical protein